MIDRLTVVGGVEGFQAYSTQIVTEALIAALEKQHVKCRVLVLSGIKVPRKLIIKWGFEFLLRYLIYPWWCRGKVTDQDLVYITDHANAGVKNWLPRQTKVVIHCHDLTSLRPMSSFPYPIRFRNRLIFWLSDRVKKKGLMRANHIIAISEFTKQELCRWLDIDARKITVAYNGIDPERFFPMDRHEARHKVGLPSGHILLTVGPASYRKNLLLVARMLALPGARELGFHWLHVGQLEDRARNLLIEEGLSDRLIERQGLSDEDMRAAYSAADLFLFPSLYEGFGLPPVEAMACGTPVIAAPTSAIPEILGDAALYADPESPEEWLRLCGDVLAKSALKQHLYKRGLRQSENYRWKITASNIMKVLISETEDK